jgi:pumilio family protein 6
MSKSRLTPIFSFNNSDKGAVSHAVVHRALWEYLSTINVLLDETEGGKLRREMFDRYEEYFVLKFCVNLEHSCQDDLAEMVHTRDGSRVVREFLAQGTAKVG